MFEDRVCEYKYMTLGRIREDDGFICVNHESEKLEEENHERRTKRLRRSEREGESSGLCECVYTSMKERGGQGRKKLFKVFFFR